MRHYYQQTPSIFLAIGEFHDRKSWWTFFITLADKVLRLHPANPMPMK
jgi:hypothetical protein